MHGGDLSRIIAFLNRIELRRTIFREAEALYSDRLAPRFNPFDFIKPNELKLSSILSWLLDPFGSHGQGGTFFVLFLRRLQANWPVHDWKNVVVKAETSVDEGRFDISISHGLRCCIIENKPWASDQQDQIRRYLDYLDVQKSNLAQHAFRDFPLIYLTPNGSSPPETSVQLSEQERRIKAGQLHCWGYRTHLLDWLSECQHQCRADRVAVFIDEFRRYIRREFGGAEDVTMQDLLVSEIVSDPGLIGSAMEVLLAGELIKEKALVVLREGLEDAVASRGWSLKWDLMTPAAKYSGLSVDFAPALTSYFRMQFEAPRLMGAIYGLAKKDEAAIIDGLTRRRCLDRLGAGLESVAWPWYRALKMNDELLPCEPNWGMSSQPWSAIADGRMATDIVSAASRFCDILLSLNDTS